MPHDAGLDELPHTLPERITVPGLWEAQGYRDLDGPVWYRRRFELQNAAGRWTLHFGAVMDEVTVYLNGEIVGGHFGAYTPFRFQVGDLLTDGINVLDVHVIDHRRDSFDHLRSAHGKQGWMNHVFPSPPSLYMTYGGIWQPVLLTPHADVAVTDVHIVADPAAVTATVEVRNYSAEPVDLVMTAKLLGMSHLRSIELAPGETSHVVIDVGSSEASPWRPDAPVLHTAVVAIERNAVAVDETRVRFGLRTFRVSANKFLLNNEPFSIRSALVQGFRADTLYAEGNRDQIVAEVLAAKQLGLNMLRLHIKAFDPLYLDVCDELGMLVHADIPIAEPIAHDELSNVGQVADRCAQAVAEQIRRDRNHPSLVLWSVMNELGAENLAVRTTPGYEAFARLLYATATTADPTRPIIENDWIEPDPDQVFCSEILTAHWYGRLSSEYLGDLASKVARFGGSHRPLFVSEFGDWGLPTLERSDDPPFWWAGTQFADAISNTPWTGSAADFVAGTQHYQGLSARLQGEIFRAHGISGWCLTELTDVPQEYNGLWDLDRRPKPAVLAEVTRLCQPLLPIVTWRTFTFWANDSVALPVTISNDGPGLDDAEVVVTIDDVPVHRWRMTLPGNEVTVLPVASIRSPGTAGDHQLEVTVRSIHEAESRLAGRNSYPLRVLTPISPDCLLDLDRSSNAGQVAELLRFKLQHGRGPLIVDEGALDAQSGALASDVLASGRDVVILCQPASAAPHLPIPAQGIDIATEWGSTPFLFTTDTEGLEALPHRALLVTEALSVTPTVVWTYSENSPWAHDTLVGLYKPYPGQILATVVGRTRVGPANLWTCQLPLCDAASKEDPTAQRIFADLFRLAIRTQAMRH